MVQKKLRSNFRREPVGNANYVWKNYVDTAMKSMYVMKKIVKLMIQIVDTLDSAGVELDSFSQN